METPRPCLHANTHAMAPRRTPIFSACALLLFLLAAAAGAPAAQTCVPSLERMLSCLDFIEHGSDEIPVPCCIQVNATVAEQPCCLMHVMRGDVAKLIGPGYDAARAMVNVTARCIGDPGILVSIRRDCAGKPLPPLTPEFTFTSAVPPPPSPSGATRLQGSPCTALLLAFVASMVYGVLTMLQI
ncbi:hypothetical protein ACP70R_048186 [Stipagrostis hirtigluma subsp. patula]